MLLSLCAFFVQCALNESDRWCFYVRSVALAKTDRWRRHVCAIGGSAASRVGALHCVRSVALAEPARGALGREGNGDTQPPLSQYPGWVALASTWPRLGLA